MILYHFAPSPYSRRVRLALAHKGLQAELRDARSHAEHLEELKQLNPFHTVPVLIDNGKVVFDSAAICHYLDRRITNAPLWPEGEAGAEAFQRLALVDGVITTLIDLGLRYAPLNDHARFTEVRENMLGRAQRGLDALAQRIDMRATSYNAWCVADMALITMVIWLETMPARALTFPPAKTMLELGWTLPASLRAWADPHRARPDVVALDR